MEETDETRAATVSPGESESYARAWSRGTSAEFEGLAPADWEARTLRIREKMAMVSAYAAARQADLRAAVRTKMLEKILDLLDRMDKPHVDFKGKDAEVVTYPIAPAEAVRAYAQSVATLLKEYRNEVGEAGETVSTTLNAGTLPSDHERKLLKDVIDEAIAIAEGNAANAANGANPVEAPVEPVSGE